jgi:hypothetical protein
VDEAALKAHNAAVEMLVKKSTAHLIPATRDPKSGAVTPNEQAKIDHIAAEVRAKHKKTIVVPATPKQVPREVDTNVEMAEQGRKVVGRASDRSPV